MNMHVQDDYEQNIPGEAAPSAPTEDDIPPAMKKVRAVQDHHRRMAAAKQIKAPARKGRGLKLAMVFLIAGAGAAGAGYGIAAAVLPMFLKKPVDTEVQVTFRPLPEAPSSYRSFMKSCEETSYDFVACQNRAIGLFPNSPEAQLYKKLNPASF